MPEIEPADKSLKSLQGLHLWHAAMSSCSQRVRIALAETGRDYESHLINLEKDEHATAAYQAIHPKGLVPALVDNGHLIIESIDIIRHIDLKLLTFEFLFRAGPPPPEDSTKAFQENHQNAWLRQFRIDFAKGFDIDRIDAAIKRTDEGFKLLDERLSDGREYLPGETFSLSDIAWMPNVHRFKLMDWPFEAKPRLMAWFERVSGRPSYTDALLVWQGVGTAEAFADYTNQRRLAGTDVRSFPHFAAMHDQD
jgi:glutathione S-transferase